MLGQTGYSYATPIEHYTGLPVDEIKALNADASAQYETTRKSKDALDLLANSLDLRDVDAPIKKKAIEKVKNDFSELVANGNYQDAQYLVSEATKQFQSNTEIKDAVKSRQLEQKYYQDQKTRLEKGEITPDAYKYGLAKAKALNANPLKYNPETFTSDNIFSGPNIIEDKSKEIYDTTYKRIADWKASGKPMTVNGRTFRVDPVKGITYDFQTGEQVKEDEVFNALKTEVEQSYQPYLQQERDIENFKKFRDPSTGQYRPVARQDINLVDSDIKTLMSGFSDKAIESLAADAKAGKKGAKLAYEKAVQERDKVDINDPKTLEQAYLAFQKKNQIDKFVYPAAEKASFTKLDHKLFDDEAAKLSLQHKYKMAEINYEKSFTAPLPSTTSQLEEFTANDYDRTIKEEQQLSTKLQESKAKLVEAQKSGNPVYISNAQKEVENLTHLNETAQNKQVDFVKGLANKDSNVSKEYFVANMDNIIQQVKQNPHKFSSTLGAEIIRLENNIATDGKGNKSLYRRPDVSVGNFKNPSVGNITREQALKLADLVEKEKERNSLLKMSVNDVTKKYNDVPSTIISSIEEAKRNHKDFSVSYQTDVFGIDDGTDKAWEKPIMDRVGDLVKNSATNWLVGNTSLDQIASGEADGFEFKDGAGNVVRPDLDKSEVRPQINHISGLNTVRILFKNSKGEPLYRDGDKRSQAAVTLTPGDQEGISTVYKQLGETLKKSADGNAQKQGVKILGYTKFAPAFSGVYLSNMENGEEKSIVIPSSQGDLYTKVKRGQGGFEMFVKTPGSDNYQPFTLKNYSGKESNTFGSKEQVEELLELNGY